jgi:hypothetical protein
MDFWASVRSSGLTIRVLLKFLMSCPANTWPLVTDSLAVTPGTCVACEHIPASQLAEVREMTCLLQISFVSQAVFCVVLRGVRGRDDLACAASHPIWTCAEMCE